MTIERLEDRIAPATLNLAGTLLTYTDIDGDLVKVTFTGGAKVTAAEIFFSSGSVDGTTTSRQALTGIDLAGQTGGGFTLTAAPQRIAGKLQGDSHANLQVIQAPDTDLGTIKVDGDVLLFSLGSGIPGTVGLKSFTALSVGHASDNTTYVSVLKNVGSFIVKTDVTHTVLNFDGGVKSLSIGGNLVEAGDGTRARIVVTGGNVGTVKIGGSIIATDSDTSNLSITGGTVGSVTIGGAITGGSKDIGADAPQVSIPVPVKSFTLGGDLRGGSGDGGGAITLGSVGTFKIGGSILGADNASFNGAVTIDGDAKSFTVGGSIIGGDSTTAPAVVTANGFIDIGGNLGSFKLGHDFIGGHRIQGVLYTSSSIIGVTGTAGSIAIGGSLVGNATHSVYLSVGGGTLGDGAVAAVKTLSIKGSVTHSSLLAGYELAFDTANTDSGFGSISIGGNLAASHIYAGSSKGSDGIPGTFDDGRVSDVATIGSVKIGGAFTGLAGDTRTYYLYAPIINKLTVAKVSYNHADLFAHASFDAIGKAVAISVL